MAGDYPGRDAPPRLSCPWLPPAFPPLPPPCVRDAGLVSLRVLSAGDRARSRRDGAFECALVNNMPDGAFVQTERQFVRLLGSPARRRSVRVRRYTLPGANRSSVVAAHVATGYLPLDHLWGTTPDAVIVTGAEPVAARLSDEPYWGDLTRLLDWSVGRVRTVLLSCLAAHAALLHFDGLRRSRLEHKRSGIYTQMIAAGHPLTVGLPSTTALPHSRYNDVRAGELRAAGWDLLMWSESAGWSIASAERHGCRLVLVQGHPEYDADTLLREFRRDLARYEQGESAEFPVIPMGYLGQKGEAALAGFLADRRLGRGAEVDFPFDALARHLRDPWRRPALQLFDNWAELADPARPAPVALG
jgi:homoserine O-succinyltransferase